MTDATVRRVENAGFVLACLGAMVALFSFVIHATHHADVFALVRRGPLLGPAVGAPAIVVLVAIARTRRARALAALWAAANLVAVVSVRARAEAYVAGLDVFLVGTAAIALGACLCAVGPQPRGFGRGANSA